MAIKLSPVKMSRDQIQALALKAQNQDSSGSRFSRSNDEENFPVFKTPEKGRFLVYVPNLRALDEEGDPIFVHDQPLIHYIKDGRGFSSPFRCTNGLTIEGTDFDGSCPLCEASSLSFDLYNAKVDHYEARTGKTVRNVDTEEAKKIRGNFLATRPVQNASRRHEVPVIVIELDQEAKGIKVLAEGNKLQYKAYWMSMSDTQYDKLSEAASVSADAIPAGKLFVFNYNYDTKGKKASSMDAARHLSITMIPAVDNVPESFLASFDDKLAEWTPEKAIEMVKESEFYAPSAVAEQMDTLMAPAVGEIASLNAEIAALNLSKGFSDEAQPQQGALPTASDSEVEAIIGGGSANASTDEVAAQYGVGAGVSL